MTVDLLACMHACVQQCVLRVYLFDVGGELVANTVNAHSFICTQLGSQCCAPGAELRQCSPELHISQACCSPKVHAEGTQLLQHLPHQLLLQAAEDGMLLLWLCFW